MRLYVYDPSKSLMCSGYRRLRAEDISRAVIAKAIETHGAQAPTWDSMRRALEAALVAKP